MTLEDHNDNKLKKKRNLQKHHPKLCELGENKFSKSAVTKEDCNVIEVIWNNALHR